MAKNIFLAVCLVGLGFGLFLYRLGDRALWSSDEGRYAEIPREMLVRADFVSPHLNYVRYFEKPPLVYWLVAANFAVFGQDERSARFWPAFLGALGLPLVWFFARRWFGDQTALWSAWFLLTAVGYFLVGRYLVLDMPFTFFLSAGLLFFLEGFEGRRGLFLPAAYIFLGLATLVKGIVACVFSFLIVVVYLTWTRQWGRWRQTGVLWGVPLLLLVVLPWFILICQRNPSFFQFFFVHEHLQRFITHSAGRPGPIYYFFGIGMLFYFPWSLFVFFIGQGLCSHRPPSTSQDRKRLFLFIWILAIFLFFSISRSKLPPYILPVLPPLAILMGFWVKEVLSRADNRFAKIVPALFGIAFVAMLVGAVVLAGYLAVTSKPEKAWVEHFIYIVAGIFVAGSGVAFLLARRRSRLAYAFFAWGAAILLAYPVVLSAMERLDPIQSSKELAGVLRDRIKPDDSVVIFGGFEDFSDLPFYLKRRCVVAGSGFGELSYGSGIGDQRPWFLSVDEFRTHLAQARAAGKNVYCIAFPNEYNEMPQRGIETLEVLFRAPKAYLLIQRKGQLQGT